MIQVLAIILLTGCFLLLWVKMIKAYPKEANLEWFKGNITHRGLYNHEQTIPENSMLAFQASMEQGYGIELDVQLTCDDHLVVFHDESLKRMCNIEKNLTDCTFEELSQYSLGNSQEKIPLFQDVLKLVNKKVPLLVEIKTNDHHCERLCRKSIEMLQTYHGDFAICSFNPFVLIYYKKQAPHIMRGQLSKHFKWDSNFPRIQKFVLQQMLFNFITKPHYISYEYNQLNLAVRVNKKIKTKCSGWAVDNISDYHKYKSFYDVLIFEHFNPKDES